MATPYSAEPTIRILDEAVFNWLSNFKVDYQIKDENGNTLVNRPQNPVLTVFASPDRAIAQVSDLLIRDGWFSENSDVVAKARADYDWAVLPLPVATVERDEPTPSNLLQMSPTLFRQAFIDSNGRYVPVGTPLHYITVYRITFWSKTRYTHSHFMEWLLAQQGLPGAGPQEIYIPVKHVEPWGTITHALRYTESANLSSLEGDDDRYIRTQVTFTLRSWLFRAFPSEARSVDPIYALNGDVYSTDGSFTESAPSFRPSSTINMYANPYPVTDVSTLWPVFGDATVSGSYGLRSDLHGLNVTLTTSPSDRVPLVQKISVKGADGVAYQTIAFKYKSTAPIAITLRQSAVDGTGESVVRYRILPASTTDWTPVQMFSSVSGAVFTWSIESAGSAAVVDVDDIDARQMLNVVKLYPTQYRTVSGYIEYLWPGMASGNYVVFGQSAGTGGGTVTAVESTTSPANGRQAVYAATDASCGLLVSAVSGLGLVVPTAVQMSSVFAVPFSLGYCGDVDGITSYTIP